MHARTFSAKKKRSNSVRENANEICSEMHQREQREVVLAQNSNEMSDLQLSVAAQFIYHSLALQLHRMAEDALEIR